MIREVFIHVGFKLQKAARLPTHTNASSERRDYASSAACISFVFRHDARQPYGASTMYQMYNQRTHLEERAIVTVHFSERSKGDVHRKMPYIMKIKMIINKRADPQVKQ